MVRMPFVSLHGHHRSQSIVLAVGCVLAIAGCGSSDPTKGGASRADPGLRFASCMRSHGVPKFPDPSSGGGIQIQASSGINPQTPAFKAAQSACGHLLSGGSGPGRGSGLGQASATFRAQLLALSRCMRADGVGGFPDPTLGPPPSNPQEFSIAIGRGGVSLLVPNTIDVSSPAFKQAAVTCHFGALLGGGQRTPAP